MAGHRSTRAAAAAAASANESDSATSASDAPRSQRRKSVRVAGAASSTTNDGRKARKQQRSSPVIVQQQQQQQLHAADESSADESGTDLVITASQLVLSPGSQSQSQSQSQYGRSARRPAVVGKAIKSASSRLKRIVEQNDSESASENGAPPSVSTTEDEDGDSDDDGEGDTTIYANGEDAPTTREGSESNSEKSPNPEVENNNVAEATPLFLGRDNITTAPSLEELADEAQGVLEAFLQKKALSLDRNEKNVLFRLRKKQRLYLGLSDADANENELSVITPTMLAMQTEDEPTAAERRQIRLIYLTLMIGALIAYRNEQLHVYDPRPGFELLAMIDPYFVTIFGSRKLRIADKAFVTCWLELKRHLERLRMEIEVEEEGASPSKKRKEDPFRLPEKVEARLRKNNREDLLRFWNLRKTAIEEDPENLNSRKYPFDTFVGLALQQAGEQYQRLQEEEIAQPLTSSPARNLSGNRQPSAPLVNGTHEASPPRQNGHRESPVRGAVTTARKITTKDKGKGRASLPASLYRARNQDAGDDRLLRDLDVSASRKKRASTGRMSTSDRIEALRQKLVRLEQLEKNSPRRLKSSPTKQPAASDSNKSLLSRHNGNHEEEDEQDEGDDSIRAVSNMLLFGAGKPKNGVDGAMNEEELESAQSESEAETSDDEAPALGNGDLDTQQTESGFDEDMEDLINGTTQAVHRAGDVFDDLEHGDEVPVSDDDGASQNGETQTQSYPIDAEMEQRVLAEIYEDVERSAELDRTIRDAAVFRNNSNANLRDSSIDPAYHRFYPPQLFANSSPAQSRTATLARAAPASTVGSSRVQFDSQNGLRRTADGQSGRPRSQMLATMLERQPDAERIEMDTPSPARQQRKAASSPARVNGHLESLGAEAPLSEKAAGKRRAESPLPEVAADDFPANDFDQGIYEAYGQPDGELDGEQEEDEGDVHIPPPLSNRRAQPTKGILKSNSAARNDYVEVSSTSDDQQDDDEEETRSDSGSDVERILTRPQTQGKSHAKAIKPASSQNKKSKDPEKAHAEGPRWETAEIRPVTMESDGKRKRSAEESEQEEEEEEAQTDDLVEEEGQEIYQSSASRKAAKARNGQGIHADDAEQAVTVVPSSAGTRRSTGEVARMSTGPRKRGRPPKNRRPDATDEPTPPVPKRPVGRSRKHAKVTPEPPAAEQAPPPLQNDNEDDDAIGSDRDMRAEAGPSRLAGPSPANDAAASVGSQEDELLSDSSSDYDPAEEIATPVPSGKGKGRAAAPSSSARKSAGSSLPKRKPVRPRKDGNSPSKRNTKSKTAGPTRYATGRYKGWSQEELDCILQCLADDPDMPVKIILLLHGPNGKQSNILADRKNDGIKDKIHDIATARERTGKARLPWYEDWTYSEKTGKLVKGRKKKQDD